MAKFLCFLIFVLFSVQAFGSEIYLKCEAIDKTVTKYVSKVEAEIIFDNVTSTSAAKYRQTGKKGVGDISEAYDYQNSVNTPVSFYSGKHYSSGAPSYVFSFDIDKEDMKISIGRSTSLWEGPCEVVPELSWFKERGF